MLGIGGIGLLCLAVLAPPLYGMEARNCGFDDRLLEVNKTERSGWNKDEFKKYDWSENVNSGVISVPYYFNPQPSRRVRSAVEEGLRYFEEHVSCIKFKETPKDRNIKQVEMNIPSRDLCGVNPDSEGVGGSVNLNVEDFTKIEEDQEGKPFLMDWNKRLYLKMTHAPCLDNWYPNDSIAEFTLWYKTFVHELFHVFGITHTMRRVDRDNYINVLYGNIPNTYQDLYQYKKNALIPVPNTPYECNSIMHYEPKTYKNKTGPDFVAIDPKTCKFNSKEPTVNDWKALKYNTCVKLKDFSG